MDSNDMAIRPTENAAEHPTDLGAKLNPGIDLTRFEAPAESLSAKYWTVFDKNGRAISRFRTKLEADRLVSMSRGEYSAKEEICQILKKH